MNSIKKIQKALEHFKNGKLIIAEKIVSELLINDSNNFEALFIKGVIDGINLKHHESKKYLMRACNINQNHGYLQFNLAKALSELGEEIQAIEHHKKAIKLIPENHDAWLNMSRSLFNIKSFDEALYCVNESLKINPYNYNAFSNKGIILIELNLYEQALENFDKSIDLNSNNADTFSNKGILLKKIRKYSEAIILFNNAIQIKPDHSEAYMNRGVTFLELRNLDEALSDLNKAIEINNNMAFAYLNKGKVLQVQNQISNSLENYEKAYVLNPEIDYLLGYIIHINLILCNWSYHYENMNSLITKINNNKNAIQPFELLAIIDSLPIQNKLTKEYINNNYPVIEEKFDKLEKTEKIKIGYFSADFREHPVSYLTAELFELHDKSKFEIVGFYYGLPDNSDIQKRIFSCFDKVINVLEVSDKKIAEISRSMKINIGVDLTGLTNNGRPGIFANRAAPIQLSYIGYLGTIGARFYDYIIADKTLIPFESQKFYTEKIIYLSNYQVNDSQRKISERIFTKREYEIPEDSFVYCSFNNNNKITPKMFDSWINILKSVLKSVLIIYVTNNESKENLRRESEKRGIDKKRIIFVGSIERSEYLARFKIADLFLDTYPYNAGTTASDSLWTGVPILSLQGETFASRISSSLLNSIGLTELITTTYEQYEKYAIDYAKNTLLQNKVKDKIKENRNTSSLFDARNFTQEIESAFFQITKYYYDNLLPDNITIKN